MSPDQPKSDPGRGTEDDMFFDGESPYPIPPPPHHWLRRGGTDPPDDPAGETLPTDGIEAIASQIDPGLEDLSGTTVETTAVPGPEEIDTAPASGEEDEAGQTLVSPITAPIAAPIGRARASIGMGGSLTRLGPRRVQSRDIPRPSVLKRQRYLAGIDRVESKGEGMTGKQIGLRTLLMPIEHAPRTTTPEKMATDEPTRQRNLQVRNLSSDEVQELQNSLKDDPVAIIDLTERASLPPTIFLIKSLFQALREKLTTRARKRTLPHDEIIKEQLWLQSSGAINEADILPPKELEDLLDVYRSPTPEDIEITPAIIKAAIKLWRQLAPICLMEEGETALEDNLGEEVAEIFLEAGNGILIFEREDLETRLARLKLLMYRSQIDSEAELRLYKLRPAKEGSVVAAFKDYIRTARAADITNGLPDNPDTRRDIAILEKALAERAGPKGVGLTSDNTREAQFEILALNIPDLAYTARMGHKILRSYPESEKLTPMDPEGLFTRLSSILINREDYNDLTIVIRNLIACRDNSTEEEARIAATVIENMIAAIPNKGIQNTLRRLARRSLREPETVAPDGVRRIVTRTVETLRKGGDFEATIESLRDNPSQTSQVAYWIIREAFDEAKRRFLNDDFGHSEIVEVTAELTIVLPKKDTNDPTQKRKPDPTTVEQVVVERHIEEIIEDFLQERIDTLTDDKTLPTLIEEIQLSQIAGEVVANKLIIELEDDGLADHAISDDSGIILDRLSGMKILRELRSLSPGTRAKIGRAIAATVTSFRKQALEFEIAELQKQIDKRMTEASRFRTGEKDRTDDDSLRQMQDDLRRKLSRETELQAAFTEADRSFGLRILRQSVRTTHTELGEIKAPELASKIFDPETMELALWMLGQSTFTDQRLTAEVALLDRYTASETLRKIEEYMALDLKEEIYALDGICGAIMAVAKKIEEEATKEEPDKDYIERLIYNDNQAFPKASAHTRIVKGGLMKEIVTTNGAIVAMIRRHLEPENARALIKTILDHTRHMTATLRSHDTEERRKIVENIIKIAKEKIKNDKRKAEQRERGRQKRIKREREAEREALVRRIIEIRQGGGDTTALEANPLLQEDIPPVQDPDINVIDEGQEPEEIFEEGTLEHTHSNNPYTYLWAVTHSPIATDLLDIDILQDRALGRGHSTAITCLIKLALHSLTSFVDERRLDGTITKACLAIEGRVRESNGIDSQTSLPLPQDIKTQIAETLANSVQGSKRRQTRAMITATSTPVKNRL